jgi:hypothetical protein
MLAARSAETGCPQFATALALPPSIARARHEAQQLLAREAPVREVSSFRLHTVKAIRGHLFELEGGMLAVPAFAPLHGRVAAVAAAACTLGPVLQARISALFQSRQPLLASALDELATEELFRLSERLLSRIRREARRRGLRAGEAQSPGDPGMALAEQPSVIALSGADAEVSARASGMLQPVKSLSFVVPLGPRLPAQTSPPRCTRCASREFCRLRGAHAKDR